MLFKELEKVHQTIARRHNASTVAIITGAKLGKDFFASMSSALLTLGNIHAPLTQTNKILSMSYPFNYIYDCLNQGYKIPGWGSSFVKGEPDPVFDDLRFLLKGEQPRLMEVVDEITDRLGHSLRVPVHPNASCYTMLCFAGYPDTVDKESRSLMGANFLIKSRLPVWTELYLENYEKGCR